jgi:molybdate transport system substrate-binding protein
MKTEQFLLLTVLLVAVALCIAGCTTTQPPATPAVTTIAPAAANQTGGSILVYAGAGLKAPMDEIGALYTNKTGVAVQYTYAGSGVLITQMNLTRLGDVFVPGSTVEFATAKNQGLVNSSQLIAYHVPVIVVQKGNPKGIKTIQDFAKPGLKVALGDTNATAIGKAGAKMFAKYNITTAVEKNVVTRTPTVNELTVIMNTGQADAAILTLDQVNPDKVDMITIPTADNVVLIVPAGVTSFTKDTDKARKFVDFVTSDEGRAIFAEHGFPLYPDPQYAGVKP